METAGGWISMVDSIIRSQRPVHRVKYFILLFFALAPGSIGARAQDSPRINSESLLSHIQTLSSDEFEGRLAGSESGFKTQKYLIDAFSGIGLPVCASEYRQEFEIRGRQEGLEGANILGLIRGSSENTDIIILSAHFDHLGIRGGMIFNGADDNASGTAALIEIAAYFLENPLAHSLLIAAFDAEESGLQGAGAFLQNPCVEVDRISIIINMDMISRSQSSELYASGTFHYPPLKKILTNMDAPENIHLLFGHDLPDTGSDDWTLASDHGPFFQRGIPYLYFGVEEHEGYHNPSDDFENITLPFYVNAVELLVDVIIEVDNNMDMVKALRQP